MSSQHQDVLARAQGDGGVHTGELATVMCEESPNTRFCMLIFDVPVEMQVALLRQTNRTQLGRLGRALLKAKNHYSQGRWISLPDTEMVWTAVDRVVAGEGSKLFAADTLVALRRQVGLVKAANFRRDDVHTVLTCALGDAGYPGGVEKFQSLEHQVAATDAYNALH